MPELLPGDKPKWTRQYVSPALDFVLREEVTNEQADKLVPGQAHPQGKYTGYVFCGLTPANEKGQYAYYAKTRAAQEAYNYQNAEVLGNEWPELRQTWVITRAAYAAAGHAQQTAPPALGGRTWTFMDSVQRRMPPEFDAIFVEVEHVWRDISTGRTDSVVDMETGQLRSEEKRIVAAGTAGQAVDAAGTYKNVQALNRLWSLQRTLQVAGLAGGGDGSTRPWNDVVNYTWPDVLLGFDLYALPAADGSIYKIAHRPIYLREAYSGPCAATITETWTKNPPIPPVLAPMLEGEVWFDGALLQLPRHRCLHGEITFYEAPGSAHPELGNYLYSQTFPATSHTDWPVTHVASFNVTPAFGGYLSRKVEINRPTTTLFANLIELSGEPTEGTVNGWTLNWTRHNPTGSLVRYRVDISTRPDFTGSFLSGWKNRNMGAATSGAVTGLVAGVVYYARVKAEITAQPVAVSNILMVAAESVVAYTLEVVETAQIVADGDTVNFGAQVFGGAALVLTLRITNTGNVALLGLAREVTGADAADWTAAALASTSLAAGATRDFTLTFDAASEGIKAAELALSTTNGEDITVDLAALAAAPDLTAESPIGFDLTSGVSTLNFSSNGITPDEQTIRLKNFSGADLTVTGISITGADAAEWSTAGIGSLPQVLADTITIDFTISFLPSGAGTYAAALEITTDDPDSPFIIYLSGTVI